MAVAQDGALMQSEGVQQEGVGSWAAPHASQQDAPTAHSAPHLGGVAVAAGAALHGAGGARAVDQALAGGAGQAGHGVPGGAARGAAGGARHAAEGNGRRVQARSDKSGTCLRALAAMQSAA